ncbi:hypothetical protein FIBSPDRAFT_982079 [Athelia psychrophila]|uniref:Uncharacterized protein n=1 Tax=Athelia psychrophila TaxID=1759441 RepID=A0A166CKK3_9AGAM|nr:hypothetical protein FIBSPDRAFT_982079 [Fibularhizoctonia sp. CBS 109695]
MCKRNNTAVQVGGRYRVNDDARPTQLEDSISLAVKRPSSSFRYHLNSFDNAGKERALAPGKVELVVVDSEHPSGRASQPVGRVLDMVLLERNLKFKADSELEGWQRPGNISDYLPQPINGPNAGPKK